MREKLAARKYLGLYIICSQYAWLCLSFDFSYMHNMYLFWINQFKIKHIEGERMFGEAARRMDLSKVKMNNVMFIKDLLFGGGG